MTPEELQNLLLEEKINSIKKQNLKDSAPVIETEQKPVTFEDNLKSWMASGGRTPPPFYDESEVEGQVSPRTFEIFQQFMADTTSGRKDTSIAQDMAKSGLELAEAGKAEIVDVPDTVDIYSEGGKQLDIPPMAQTILEKIANTVITGLGYAEAGVGFTVGSIADALVKAGMNESSARKLANDVMAMPEAFAGSPSMFFKSKGELIKPEMPTTYLYNYAHKRRGVVFDQGGGKKGERSDKAVYDPLVPGTTYQFLEEE